MLMFMTVGHSDPWPMHAWIRRVDEKRGDVAV